MQEQDTEVDRLSSQWMCPVRKAQELEEFAAELDQSAVSAGGPNDDVDEFASCLYCNCPVLVTPIVAMCRGYVYCNACKKKHWTEKRCRCFSEKKLTRPR